MDRETNPSADARIFTCGVAFTTESDWTANEVEKTQSRQ